MPRATADSERAPRKRQYEKRLAFFPGYLFVSFDLMRDRWRSLNGTNGITSLIMQSDLPVCYPPCLVEHFLDLTSDDGVLNFEALFTPGQKALVARGSFSSLSGWLVKLSNNGRVQILLEIMNGNINVTLGTRDIVPRSVETAGQLWGRISGDAFTRKCGSYCCQ